MQANDMGRRNDAKLMGPNATAAFIPPWHSPWSVPVRGQHRLSREALKGGGVSHVDTDSAGMG